MGETQQRWEARLRGPRKHAWSPGRKDTRTQKQCFNRQGARAPTLTSARRPAGWREGPHTRAQRGDATGP